MELTARTIAAIGIAESGRPVHSDSESAPCHIGKRQCRIDSLTDERVQIRNPHA